MCWKPRLGRKVGERPRNGKLLLIVCTLIAVFILRMYIICIYFSQYIMYYDYFPLKVWSWTTPCGD